MNQDAIVAAAMALADESGERGLTMRKLAERVGYEVMSLYNHVANKGELLDLMAEGAAGEVPMPDEDAPPFEALRDFAVASQQVLARRPWAAALWLSRMPGPIRIAQVQFQLRQLAISGLSPDLAHHGYHAISNHIVGYTLQNQAMEIGLADPEATMKAFLALLSPDDHDHVINHVEQHQRGETGSSFELVLDFILDGLQRTNGDSGYA